MNALKQHFSIPQQSGYTFIEIMAALSISAILLSQAQPNLAHFFQSQQANAVSRELVQLVKLTRSYAVNRSSRVTLCPSQDSSTCSKQWQQGIIVFADTDANGKRSEDEELLRVSNFLPSDSQLAWRAWGGSRYYLQYTSQGRTRSQNGRFSFCLESAESRYVQQIIINKAGRPRKAFDHERKLDHCQK